MKMSKKKTNSLALFMTGAFALFCALAACGGTPPPKQQWVPAASSTTTPLEHKGTAFGMKLPEWVIPAMTSSYEVEKLADFKDFYCFVSDRTGQNLDALKMWANNYEVVREISAQITTRVDAKIDGVRAAVNGSAEYGASMKEKFKTGTESTFTGARKAGDWWIYQQKNGKNEYQYILLFTIPRKNVDQQVLGFFEGSSAQNDSQRLAKNLLMEQIRKDGLD